MNKRKKTVPIWGLLACLLVAGGVAAAPAAITVDGWVMGGGGTRLITPPYTIEATIGQPVVGLSVYSDGELCSGFWCEGAARARLYLPVVLRHASP
jgi:hypothetical protein